MKYYLLTGLCVFFTLFGCKDTNLKDENTTYVGGQINNPESSYVILSQGNKIIDTLYLDEKNQFGKDFQDLKSGIYTFKHPPENQTLYIEPGDSIVIWLNTLSFDKSLNFSGEGAEESNFLLNMFLNNQENNDLVLTYYKMSPENFARVSDSIRKSRLENLNKLKAKNNFSEEFTSIAEKIISYEFYDLRERYTFLIEKYYPEIAETIPEDFNDYRENINFNDNELKDYYVYTNLIDDYLRTKSIEYCEKNHLDKKCFDLNSFDNIRRRMLLIDSLSNLQALKNEFLDRLADRSIIMAESKERIDSILSTLQEIGYSNLEEAKNLADVQKGYFVGNSLKDLKAENTKGEIKTYGEIIKKPTITYAWSIYAPAHHRWQHKIIKQLKKKYPELDFLGVNIDLGDREEWLRTLENYDYDKEDEYQIAERSTSKETYKKYLNKVLFIDPKGTIVHGDVQFGNPHFEEEILEFLNRE
ncbi:hypothetical protein C7S20_11600 [Christiangramia fulva]|uniref:Thioredoxin domain-containing protein n=1 Tax=Christiangramia fulva TaxID=2126553 RepID=A0A2R3Z6C8_9FLAO|nr:hypothetical protein [Christiangramia fulva]AVR45843.1 hypothetical protein C7S20_11600 [Christiangramia fulva]